LTTMMYGRGRIVLPKQIREEMRIDYGMFLVVEKESDDVIRLRIVGTDTAPPPSVNKDSSIEREKPRRFLGR